MIVKYRAIFKLAAMLEKANIPFYFLDRSYEDKPFFQIEVYEDDRHRFRLISVVQGFATLGEYHDLLEIMGCMTEEECEHDSVLGFLTAEEVFKRIDDRYER